jgi:hypothetical protein
MRDLEGASTHVELPVRHPTDLTARPPSGATVAGGPHAQHSRWFCVMLVGCKTRTGTRRVLTGPESSPEDPYIDAPCDQLTVARTCADCDVAVRWSAVTRDW